MALSLDFLEKLGYYAVNVEHRPRIPGRADLLITRDLFGFADIVALKDHVLLVQTTSRTNMAARQRKIQCAEAFEPCKRAGMLIHVHGWDPVAGLKIADMTNEKSDWAGILLAQKLRKQKRSGHLITQKDLELEAER